MTLDEMIDQCNRAWHEGRIGDWLDLIERLKARAALEPDPWNSRAEAAQRLETYYATRSRELEAFQKDHDEYIEDMSLGGQRYEP